MQNLRVSIVVGYTTTCVHLMSQLNYLSCLVTVIFDVFVANYTYQSRILFGGKPKLFERSMHSSLAKCKHGNTYIYRKISKILSVPVP